MATIAIDLDDTLHDTQNVLPGYKMGQPTPGAVDTAKQLVDDGHILIIFTARNVQDQRIYRAVESWLNYFKIPFAGITNIKHSDFDVIIDNRALRFHTWQQVLDELPI